MSFDGSILEILRNNNLSDVQKLYRIKSDLDEIDFSRRDSENNNALHYALNKRYIDRDIYRLDVIKLLLENGTDVNQKNSDTETPISILVQTPDIVDDEIRLELVKILIQFKADFDIKDMDEDIPLFLVLDNQFISNDYVKHDIFEILLQNTKNADLLTRHDQNILHQICSNINMHDKPRLEILKTIIRDSNIDFNQQDNDGNTPLMILLCNYTIKDPYIRLGMFHLLNRNTNHNLINNYNHTSLILACQIFGKNDVHIYEEIVMEILKMNKGNLIHQDFMEKSALNWL